MISGLKYKRHYAAVLVYEGKTVCILGAVLENENPILGSNTVNHYISELALSAVLEDNGLVSGDDCSVGELNAAFSGEYDIKSKRIACLKDLYIACCIYANSCEELRAGGSKNILSVCFLDYDAIISKGIDGCIEGNKSVFIYCCNTCV